MSTSIVGRLAPELWHIICGQLDYEDLVNVRLACKALAIVGAEYLVNTIRFQTTPTSLKRLAFLAEHPHLRKNVKHLIYEGALIRDMSCIHLYSRHYELGRGAALKPQLPPDNASARTKRLYRRNLDKFNQDVKRKFDKYSEVLQAQQQLLNDVKARNELFGCIASFPNLCSLKLATDAMCLHALSDRFREEFGEECPAPLQWPNDNSVWQLQNCLVTGLSDIDVRSVSPQFFNGLSGRTDSWLHDMFSTLISIRLTLRGNKEASSTLTEDAFSVLQDGRLKRALGAAKQLQNICLNFQIQSNEVHEASSIEHILGQNTWPDLTDLEFDFLHCSSEDELMGMLARQPKLSILSVAFVRLERGEWTSVTRKMRDQLDLVHFFAEGVLEDEIRLYPMSLCERDAWLDEYELTLSQALDAYVGKVYDPIGSEDEDESDVDESMHQLYNPLYHIDEEYDERDILTARYGSLPTSDHEFLGSDGMEDPHDGLGVVVEHHIHHHHHHDEFHAGTLHSDDELDSSVYDVDSEEDDELPDLVPMDLDSVSDIAA